MHGGSFKTDKLNSVVLFYLNEMFIDINAL